jgi:hypothetical protein
MKKTLALGLLALAACHSPKDWDPEDARDHVPYQEPVTVDHAIPTPSSPDLQYMVMNVEDARALTNWLDSRSEAESFRSDWASKYPNFGSYIVWRQKPAWKD